MVVARLRLQAESKQDGQGLNRNDFRLYLNPFRNQLKNRKSCIVGANCYFKPWNANLNNSSLKIKPRKREYGSFASQNSIIRIAIDLAIQKKNYFS
jgi:hypothetical protein